MTSGHIKLISFNVIEQKTDSKEEENELYRAIFKSIYQNGNAFQVTLVQCWKLISFVTDIKQLMVCC